MAEEYTARQQPTAALILPYEHTKGSKAVKLYNMATRTKALLPWQELLCYDIMAVRDDGLWTHTRFGYAVPRRNGKTEDIFARELYGLMYGEHMLHTAHLADTEHDAFERLLSLVEGLGLKPDSYRAKGSERISIQGGGMINFRTRTETGNLGSGYDLLVIDEAQELTSGQMTALNYIVSASKNPQIVLTGTPPTAVSNGDYFAKFRELVLSGQSQDFGWAEWGVESQVDINDEYYWYETNPSLGTVISERSVRNELGPDALDFCIQRLGLWTKFDINSAISEREWNACKCEVLPKLTGKLTAAVKFGHDNKNISLSIACKTDTEKIFVETIACRPAKDGMQWLIRFFKQAAGIEQIVIDGRNGAQTLIDGLQNEGIETDIISPSVGEIISASTAFEPAIINGTICHMGQPGVVASVSHSRHRAIGTNGGFGYQSTTDINDISITESVILAFYFCSTAKPKHEQFVFY